MWRYFPPCSWCVLIGPTVPQVPPQPLWFAPGLANVRKLQELTYHLLHAGLWDELRQEVIGKMCEEAHYVSLPSFNKQNHKTCFRSWSFNVITVKHKWCKSTLKKYFFLSVSANQWIHLKCYCCVCQAVLSGCTVRAGCAGCPVWSRTWTSAPSTWTARRPDWSETLWSWWNPVWTSWMVTWVSYSVSILHISMFSDRFCSKRFQEYNERPKSIQNQNRIKWEINEKRFCY